MQPKAMEPAGDILQEPTKDKYYYRLDNVSYESSEKLQQFPAINE